VTLGIEYASYLQSRIRNRKGQLNELSIAEKSRPSIDQQFLIFIQWKLFEDELAEGQEHGGIDFEPECANDSGE
jgi:hypothetical protein